jgi:hypothetical protein
MSYPKTKEEWFALLRENKGRLLTLIGRFHPWWLDNESIKQYSITAPKAEEICEKVRETIKESTKLNPHDEFIKALENEDGVTISKILNSTWFGMPESYEIRTVSGFHALCDLCSESYLVLEEGEEFDE